MNTLEHLCNYLFVGFLFCLAIWVLVKVSHGMKTTRKEREEMGIKTRDQDTNNES